MFQLLFFSLLATMIIITGNVLRTMIKK